METEVMVKRVIKGRAYNTDTADLIARYRDQTASGVISETCIYRTRAGAYFKTAYQKNLKDDDTEVELTPLTKEEAKSILSGEDSGYSDMKFTIVGNADELQSDIPEAAGEDEADQHAVIFFRVSKPFKTSIEAVAKASGLSVNAWMLRTIEAEMSRHEIDGIQDAVNLINDLAETFKAQQNTESLTIALSLSMVAFFLNDYSVRILSGETVDAAKAGVVRGDLPLAGQITEQEIDFFESEKWNSHISDFYRAFLELKGGRHE